MTLDPGFESKYFYEVSLISDQTQMIYLYDLIKESSEVESTQQRVRPSNSFWDELQTQI